MAAQNRADKTISEKGKNIMQYTIEEKLPTPAQWMALRESVGWATFPHQDAERSLALTPYCICAFEGEQLIGMGRVLGDCAIAFYVGSVIVLPEHQGRGVGSKIMRRLMAYVEANAVPGAVASLMAVKGKEDYYTQFGFERRPDEFWGSGMSRRF